MKRLHVVVDTDGWAYARRARALQKHAPADWSVTYGTGLPRGELDVVLQLNFSSLKRTLRALDGARVRPRIVGAINAGWPRLKQRLDPLAAACDAVLFCNRDYHVQAGSRPGTYWLGYGVDRDLFSPGNAARAPEHRVLWMGSKHHTWEKGWFDVVEPLQEALRARGIASDFKLVDSLDPPYPPEDMPGWYRSGTIYLVASRTEGGPNTALEAAACGLVVVGTRVGLLPDLIEHDVNGMLLETREVGAFVASIEHVIANHGRMRAAMLEKIPAWDWSLRVPEYFELFDRIAEAPAAAPRPRRRTWPRRFLNTEPRCLTVQGAIASAFELPDRDQAPPEFGVPERVKFITRGCLYDPAGRKLSLAERSGGKGGDLVMAVDPEHLPADGSSAAAPLKSGRTLFLGYFMSHYGHFVTEFLSRLWAVERGGSFDRLVAYPFIFDGGRVRPQRYHSYLAGLLGVRLERVEVLRTPVRFEEIVIPEQLWTINGSVNQRMRPLYARIRDRHAAAASSGRLFLSRRGNHASSRIANTREVEEIFHSFGFRVILPEEHDIEAQLDLYANCEILAGLSGSGMHNCLFVRPGTPVIEVGDLRARRRPVVMQTMANRLAGVRRHFLPYEGGEDGRTDPGVLARRLSDILGEQPRRRVLPLPVARLLERVPRWVRRRGKP